MWFPEIILKNNTDPNEGGKKRQWKSVIGTIFQSDKISLRNFQNTSTIKLLILFQDCTDKQKNFQTHLDEGLNTQEQKKKKKKSDSYQTQSESEIKDSTKRLMDNSKPYCTQVPYCDFYQQKTCNTRKSKGYPTIKLWWLSHLFSILTCDGEYTNPQELQ